MKVHTNAPSHPILSVSDLTRSIKEALEGRFPDLWVEGEISNLKIPPSQHIYFTLKDDFSQIRAVCFRLQARGLRFLPEDGLHVVCRGRVSLYEKRGEYQLVIDQMEPKGVGALQLAFLQLRERLEREGLFEQARKRPLPLLPQRIGIVTSPTGAVIRDMIHVIQRRFQNVSILLYPVRVQGEGAALEIAEGIKFFSAQSDVDVVIVGRGGGSLEDLWAFNEEIVARAIFVSKVPIISAVGHETDYTIADFVADVRAPTPSAAAELVVREKKELQKTVQALTARLEKEARLTIEDRSQLLSHLRKRWSDPRRRVEDLLFKVDDLTDRLRSLTVRGLNQDRERALRTYEKLCFRFPGEKIKHLRTRAIHLTDMLTGRSRHNIEMRKQKVAAVSGKLDSLSPLSILKRGYSIARRVSTMEVLRSTSQIQIGEQVGVKLHEGELLCQVEKKI